jgi:hypothetical protein
MRRRLASAVAAATVTTTLAVFGGVSGAQAADSQNVGWLYTVGAGGAVFFDADLAGYTGYEKITVCDNNSNGKGVKALVREYGGSESKTVSDPSNDGHCAAVQGNFIPDGEKVEVRVWEYNADDPYQNEAWAYGYA